MRTDRENGYSANVKAFLVVDGKRIGLAKTNGSFVVLAESAESGEAPKGAIGDLLVIIDDRVKSRQVQIPEGITTDQKIVPYQAIM